MKKMLEVSLVVRCGDSINEPFHTDTGAPQGDCASTNILTYYLAKSLEVQIPDRIIHDHHCYHQSITSHEISYEATRIIMHNQRKSNISILKWCMPMILARLPVTTTAFADMNIMWKRISVKKD